jgi:NAD(P)-dependent dehydrogenase (short-subunit alcohol dehydrogenase family)
MFWVCSEANLTKPDHILRRVIAGHFYLTKLLLPLLTATAKNAPAKTVRVINVSSLGHYLGAPEGIRWTSIVPGTESLEARKKLGSARLYGQSKTVGSMPSLPIRPIPNLPKGKYPLLK